MYPAVLVCQIANLWKLRQSDTPFSFLLFGQIRWAAATAGKALTPVLVIDLYAVTTSAGYIGTMLAEAIFVVYTTFA